MDEHYSDVAAAWEAWKRAAGVFGGYVPAALGTWPGLAGLADELQRAAAVADEQAGLAESPYAVTPDRPDVAVTQLDIAGRPVDPAHPEDRWAEDTTLTYGGGRTFARLTVRTRGTYTTGWVTVGVTPDRCPQTPADLLSAADSLQARIDAARQTAPTRLPPGTTIVGHPA